MKTRCVVCILLTGWISAGAETTRSTADLLHAALAAMGGEEKIRSLDTVHFEASVMRNELEQSERPEGPYIIENDQIEEWRDLKQGAWKRTAKLHGAMQPEFVMRAVVSEGAALLSYNGQPVPASGEQLQNAQEDQTVDELKSAVEREHLSVDRFFMMHIGPNPWSNALQAVQAAR